MSNYQLWKGKSSHKAAAISLDGSYAAWSDSSLDPLTAARIALYRCNHSGGFSRLCKLLVIDDVLIPNLDDTAKTESNEILNQLRNNKPRLQPDEVTPGSRNVNAMKTDGFVGLTPQSLSGIPSINSSELLNALLSDTPPLIIDVSATGSRMIPTSIHLLLGGLAFKDQALDFQYDLRFKGILRALGANNERIIIFYTDSDSNWFAANAALRAKAAGYQDVRWYRAGLEAWTRNQLRTIQKFPNAVMN